MWRFGGRPMWSHDSIDHVHLFLHIIIDVPYMPIDPDSLQSSKRKPWEVSLRKVMGHVGGATPWDCLCLKADHHL